MARTFNLSWESGPQAASRLKEKTVLSPFPSFTDVVKKKKKNLCCGEKLESEWTLTRWLISKGTFSISFFFRERTGPLLPPSSPPTSPLPHLPSLAAPLLFLILCPSSYPLFSSLVSLIPKDHQLLWGARGWGGGCLFRGFLAANIQNTLYFCYLLTSPWHLEGKSLFPLFPSAAGEELIPDPRFLQQDLDVQLGFYRFFSLPRPYLLLSGNQGSFWGGEDGRVMEKAVPPRSG